MDEKQILELAIKTFGEKAQEEIAIEECSELIQAICHKHRGRENNIPEEIADVLIAVEQLIMTNDCREEVERIRAEKIARLAERVFDKYL